MKDDRIFLYDSYTGLIVARILTNHGMTIDEMLDLNGYTTDDNGQLIDESGDLIDAWYENLETCYGDEWTADRFVALPEYTDRIYGSETPSPVSLAEIKRLADEWDMRFGVLMEEFEEAEED